MDDVIRRAHLDDDVWPTDWLIHWLIAWKTEQRPGCESREVKDVGRMLLATSCRAWRNGDCIKDAQMQLPPQLLGTALNPFMERTVIYRDEMTKVHLVLSGECNNDLMHALKTCFDNAVDNNRNQILFFNWLTTPSVVYYLVSNTKRILSLIGLFTMSLIVTNMTFYNSLHKMLHVGLPIFS